MSTNRHKLKPSLVRKAEYYPISIAKLIISASRFQNELLVYKAALCFDLVKVRPKPNCCTIHELQVLKFFFKQQCHGFLQEEIHKKRGQKERGQKPKQIEIQTNVCK